MKEISKKGLDIWLVQTGEELPIDNKNIRLFRTGLLARSLSQRQHKVTWWASNFSHLYKKHIAKHHDNISYMRLIDIKLIRSLGYKNNIGISRLINNIFLSIDYKALINKANRPDIIISSYPTIELSLASVLYGKKNNVPVIIDVRDMWPDTFLNVIPIRTLGFNKLLIIPFEKLAKLVFKEAFAITGISEEYVKFGLRYASRRFGKYDRWFPLAYQDVDIGNDGWNSAAGFWDKLIISRNENTPIFSYLGSFGEHPCLDIKTLLIAARLLQQNGIDAKIILCGIGPSLQSFKEMAKGLYNVIFPGFIDYKKISALLKISTAGLLPYLPYEDFKISIPNKVAEYLSAGLPIVTSLKGGVLEKELGDKDCLYLYEGKNPYDLYNVLLEVINDKEKYKRKAKNAKGTFLQKFKADVVYSEMADYIEEVYLAHKSIK